MIRKTQCACGQVNAVVEGEPSRVFVCHCDYCQKRTGSVFQVSCYFPHERVLELNGDTVTFSTSPGSIGILYEFCPRCGTTVHWTYGVEMERSYPGMSRFRGFAVGCFADPAFPTPQIEFQKRYAHHWVPALPVVHSFSDFGNPDLSIAGAGDPPSP